eukprot:4689933-Amphidinium_carterae.1
MFRGAGGGGGGMSTSTSTVTKIVNGKRVTVTEKTVRGPDGRVETTTTTSEGLYEPFDAYPYAYPKILGSPKPLK